MCCCVIWTGINIHQAWVGTRSRSVFGDLKWSSWLKCGYQIDKSWPGEEWV